MAETTRSVRAGRAEDFLELVERGKSGRLKLYLGFAAGVGKTYRMLQEAHELRKRGVDVVLGFIETHGRAETQALVADLELVPRQLIFYRGVEVAEMSLDGILARQPQVVVVDELAHTNVPGSRHGKRYQDVLALLDQGINVIGAFNIQHLESLNSLVERVTGVWVRETVPDGFLRRADQVVNLDLAVEDLQDRLRAGKIYAADRVPSALESFFKSENLAALRELSLREVAETLERVAAGNAAVDALESRRAVEGRVMVCLSSHPPDAVELLQRGARVAGRLATDWFAVYVETPDEAPDRIDAEAQRHLLANIERARMLGAEVVRLQSSDPAEALLDFARSAGIGHILVGRSHEPSWRRLFRRSIAQRLFDEAEGFELHVVDSVRRSSR